MIPILTREQIQAYDRHASERHKVRGLILMENAGRGAAEHVALMAEQEIKRLPPGHAAGPVVIVCGPGNNGGDGFVVGRHLLARGLAVEIFLVGPVEGVRGDARVNLDAFVGIGGELAVIERRGSLAPLRRSLQQSPLVVDAIFGTGLARAVEGRYAEVIATINACECPRVSLDIPSGIDANDGRVLGSAVKADLTVTFAHHKAGLLVGQGPAHAGRIERVGLGLPDEEILDEVGQLGHIIDEAAVASWLGHRPRDLHKYRAGSVLVVAGSPGRVGAALLAARAALRSGAGIASIATWPEAADSIDAQIAELMTIRLYPAQLEAGLEAALERRKAAAIGPGLGLGEHARRLTERLVLGWDGPVVVDADAITHFAGRAERLREAPGPRVLTPHAGELARLLGTDAAGVEADPLGCAREAAGRTGATVALKGPHTVICSPDALLLCTRGDAVLATAGSGDVLTGMVAALLCSLAPMAAAAAAVYLHAFAGERWREREGADRGMVASDIVDGIPAAIAAIRR
ncbi:MAG: NAD(P)H-hydrate dehydratase [Deltaproteobacteria bacterium]|nr:NAD(P)H-hydrate dehydratase [Deltaproteobacteria bacterium]